MDSRIRNIVNVEVGDLVELVPMPLSYPIYDEVYQDVGVGLVIKVVEEYTFLPPIDEEAGNEDGRVETIKMCLVFWNRCAEYRWEFPEDLGILWTSSRGANE